MQTLRWTAVPLALAAIVSLAPRPAEAMRPVGLGATLGVGLPNGPANLGDIKPTFDWGFFTDIPLVSVFHISPSTTLYRLDPSAGGGVAATDVSLNFKFIVPLGPLEPFAGVTGGVTSTTKLEPHVGGMVGLSVNVVSNLDLFASLNYRLILRDGGNVGAWHIFAGPIFRFAPG